MTHVSKTFLTKLWGGVGWGECNSVFNNLKSSIKYLLLTSVLFFQHLSNQYSKTQSKDQLSGEGKGTNIYQTLKCVSSFNVHHFIVTSLRVDRVVQIYRRESWTQNIWSDFSKVVGMELEVGCNSKAHARSFCWNPTLYATEKIT